MVANGAQADLDAVTVVTTGGGIITLGNVANGLIITTVSVAYAAGFNTGPSFTLSYPEPFGATSPTAMNIPVMYMFNDVASAVMQATTLQNYSIYGSGIVTVQKTGLIAGLALRFKFILV